MNTRTQVSKSRINPRVCRANPLFAVIAAAFVITVAASSVRAGNLVSDDFDDGVIDPLRWTTDTSTPQGGASVAETGGLIQFVNRGILITANQFDPLNGGLQITGRWTFVSAPFEDFLQVTTRGDGVGLGPNGEILNGVQFHIQTLVATSPPGSMNMLIRDLAGAALPPTVEQHVQVASGETFDFEITDDGFNLTFTVVEVGGDGTTATLTTTSALNPPSNFISINNRERVAGNYVALLDDYSICSLDSDGDGVPDAVDACPDSILSETVIIEDCDSGVENILFDDGCTLADLVQLCADESKNHGAFMSCVSKLAIGLKKGGVLTGKEQGKLVSCAARSGVGK